VLTVSGIPKTLNFPQVLTVAAGSATNVKPALGEELLRLLDSPPLPGDDTVTKDRTDLMIEIES
jgi:hypothetical protein